MSYLDLFLLISFIASTGIGYYKNSRNKMLLGILCLIVLNGYQPFFQGVEEGFREAKAAKKVAS